MNEEYVSIILPTYNRVKTLEKSINSVLEQTYTKFELLVIDDGSTDGTESLVKETKDDRVHYVKGEHKGAAAARNLGMKHAKYDYIAFQDSDDLWIETKLEKQMTVLSETDEEVALVYCMYKYHSLDGKKEILWPPEEWTEEACSGNILKQLLRKNLIGTPTMLFKKKCLEKVGVFYEELLALEDYEFALRVAKQYKVAYVKEPLLQVYESNDSISNNNTAYFVGMCYIINSYKKELLNYGLFDDVVSELLKKAETLGVVEAVSKMLERMLTS